MFNRNKLVCRSRSLFTVNDPVSLSSALQKTRDKLESASIPEAEISSRFLISQVLGETSPNGYLNHEDRLLETGELTELNRILSCRLARVPVQYIAGTWDFRQICLKVRPPVFIPRVETEQLVDIVLNNLPTKDNVRILEIGPGSGNICLSLLTERDHVSVTALERSQVAADLTRENAKNLGLDSRLDVVELRVDDDTQIPEKFDLVVSNPPYILRKDLMNLEPEITLYEDLRALDGGAEGLDTILAILKVAGQVLPQGGEVFLEVDPCHSTILPDHLDTLPVKFVLKQVYKDYRDKDRFICLSKL